MAAAVVAFGVAPVAIASGGFGRLHDRPESQEELRTRFDGVADRVLERTNATAAQRTAVDARLDALADDLWERRGDREAHRGAVLAALSAERVDRRALEDARQAMVDGFDDATKLVIDALADLAETFTPAQRAQIAAQLDALHPPE
jgi:Spy/CpxP family protein refolding chaperone